MVTVRCFGGATAIDEAGVEITLRSRKHVGLFLYLAAHARTTHSREELADLLWDGAGRRERHSLSQALYDIRSHAGRVMDVTTKTVRLLPERVRYEMQAFEQAVTAGDHETALELYRGEFAPNLLNLGVEEFDRWLDAERERSRVLAAIALRNAQRAAEERGDWDQMALAALRLIKQNEFDEEAHCALMRGLWMKGDPASALAHYRSLPQMDARGWGTLPQLASLIEQSGSAREILSRPAPTTNLVGLDVPFRRLVGLLRGRTAAPNILVAGASGLGKSALLRQLSRLLEATGAHVDWLTLEASWSRLELADARLASVIDGNLSAVEIQALLESKSFPHPVLVTTRATQLDTGKFEMRGELEVIELDRLPLGLVRRAILDKHVGIDAAVASRCAGLSGGNTGVALELARVSRDRERLEAMADLDLIQSALAASSWLRRWVRSTLASLSPEARAAAEMLSVLHPTAAGVASCLASRDAWNKSVCELRGHSLLVEEGKSVRLANPVLAHAIRAGVGEERARELQVEFARIARRGEPEHQFAGAIQVHEAGRPQEALELANGAIGAALRLADRETAARAASFIWSTARVQKDRLAAGLLAAETEITRGRIGAAEALLSELGMCSDDHNVQVDVSIGLARIALLRRDYASAERQAIVLGRLRSRVSGYMAERAELQLAATRLVVAQSATERQQAVAAADTLARILNHSAPRAEELGWIWLDAVQALVWHVANARSRSVGVRVLQRYAAELTRVPQDGRSSLRLLQAVLEVRGARLRTAEGLLEGILESSKQAADRRSSAIMNNLAVVNLESGAFGVAHDWLSRTRVLDRDLGLPAVQRVATLLNQALFHFFSGDPRSSETCCEEVLAVPSDEIVDSQRAQAIAIKGLCSLRARDLSTAKACVEQLDDVVTAGAYEDDEYTLHWFRAVETMQRSRKNPSEVLLEAADRSEPFDELGALKLRVLAYRMATGQGDNAEFGDVKRRLRAAGAAWFDRFVRAFAHEIGNERAF